jgi:UDP-N-acetylmuramoyl-L-alanyl-D-glutamate--2,6-diaminopimelate ligase
MTMLPLLGIEAEYLTTDSRKAGPGAVFLAYPGEHADGRAYIAQAIAQGASGVLWESAGFAWQAEWNVPNAAVANLRAEAGAIADAFYGRPSQALNMIGITGTNGKTSCSHWLAIALTHLGRKTAAIGTLGNGFPGSLADAVNTTPDPVLLHALLADYRTQGANGAAMEVSSHGLAQGRVNGVAFDIAMLTNLSRDHLDYHGDMRAYADAKRRLFYWPGLKSMVVNADDDFGAELLEECEGRDVRILSYGLQTGDVRGQGLQFKGDGLAMDVITPVGRAHVEARLMGRFNAYNLLAVLATLLACDIPLAEAVEALRDVTPVAGRMQTLGGGTQPLVVIDYAHTPDALEKALEAARLHSGGHVVTVFGCGGDRDRAKRPLMGEAAGKGSDLVVLTSDNPRSEDPLSIINDALPGLQRTNTKYVLEPDRRRAIAMALSDAQAGDIVIIAGKGHERTQTTREGVFPFDDFEVAREELNKLGYQKS